MIIDIAVPGDVRIRSKEQDKIIAYQDLKMEIKNLWNLKSVIVVPIVIGALGAVTNNLEKNIKMLGCQISLAGLQKTALLGTAHIIRKVLNL